MAFWRVKMVPTFVYAKPCLSVPVRACPCVTGLWRMFPARGVFLGVGAALRCSVRWEIRQTASVVCYFRD